MSRPKTRRGSLLFRRANNQTCESSHVRRFPLIVSEKPTSRAAKSAILRLSCHRRTIKVVFAVHERESEKPRRYSTVMKLERYIHSNAARLFGDACTLIVRADMPQRTGWQFWHSRNSEKIQLVDHVAFEAVLNGGSYFLDPETMKHLFSRGTFYSHTNKQGAFGNIRNRSIGPLVSLTRTASSAGSRRKRQQ